MRLSLFLPLFLAAGVCVAAGPAKFTGRKFDLALPEGYTLRALPNGRPNDADDGGPLFIARNGAGHEITAFLDSDSTLVPGQIRAAVDLIKRQPPTPSSQVVSSGMVKGGGRLWGMVELDDTKAPIPDSQHVILLLTSIEDRPLRLILGSVHQDAEDLITEANDVMAGFEPHAAPPPPLPAPGPARASAAVPEAPAPQVDEPVDGPYHVLQDNPIPGISQSQIYLAILEDRAATAAPDGTGPSARPPAKARPRLLHPVVDPTEKLRGAAPEAESPLERDANEFLTLYANRISAEWDEAMRRESADWHPAIEVHFIFSVDVQKGTVAIESQSSPADQAGLERFRKLLESLGPVVLPESFHAICGKALHLRLNFRNSKALPAATPPDNQPEAAQVTAKPDATIRPAGTADHITNTTQSGILGLDPRWNDFGGYVQELVGLVEARWHRLLDENLVTLPHASHVSVKFKINSQGGVRILSIDETKGKLAGSLCANAVSDPQPYRKWTAPMIAALGDEQTLTFSFYYR